MVSSTHNHEGPDVIGLWGKSFFQKGTDEKYMKLLVDRIVGCVKEASSKLKPVVARFVATQQVLKVQPKQKLRTVHRLKQFSKPTKVALYSLA